MTQEEVTREVGDKAVAMKCDVTKEEDIKNVVSKVESQYGPVQTLIYNAGSGVFKTYDQLSLAEFDMCMATNTRGLLVAAQAICPGMVKRGSGVVAVTGATASLRGKPYTAGFATAKGAQRMLVQSLARDLGPKGVHVFLSIIDGQVAGGAYGEGDKKMDPEHIAETYWNVANQNKSSWSFEVDLRPFCENW